MLKRILIDCVGFQYGSLIYLWPWCWYKNNWRPCFSLDFHCPVWSWFHYKYMWWKIDKIVKEKAKK